MSLTDPMNPDTDGDGLRDSLEFMLYEKGKDLGESKLMSPLNSTDIYGDFDRDGIPNIYDWDDDNDSLNTIVELQIGLNPYNSHDPYGDKDADGLSNIFEYKHGLNIQDSDTDHDGIDGGADFGSENLKIPE